MKRTFVVPDDKEVVYEKFKGLVKEVSGSLVEMMEEYVRRHEALQAGMAEQTTYKGVDDHSFNVFDGKTFKFNGILLSKGKHEEIDELYYEVYLTQKGKFLVYTAAFSEEKATTNCWFDTYETYAELKEKAKLPNSFIKDCEAYLNKNSTIRTYEVLDV